MFLVRSIGTKGTIPMADEEFPFKVVRTNGHDEVLARSINPLMGRAAFETAKRLYPRDQLEYRKGAQVLDRSNRDDE
jgi:hypothetical protein